MPNLGLGLGLTNNAFINTPILNQVAGSVFAISSDKLKSGATSPYTLSFSNAAPNLVATFSNGTLNKEHVENYIKSVNGGNLVGMSVYVQQATDQSGNGNHAIQNTASNQPRVMNNGIWDVDGNGKVSPYFNGTTSVMNIINTLVGYENNLFINIVVRPNSNQLTYTAIIGNHNAISDGGFSIEQIASNNNLYCLQMNNGSIFHSIGNTQLSANTNNIFTLYKSEINGKNYLNGVNTVSINNSSNNIKITTQFVYIGWSAYPSENRRFNGYINEIIIYNKTLSDSERQKLEKNQGKRYGITVA